MPSGRLLPPRLLLAAGPTALAFLSGGYFAGPRLGALLAAAVALAWVALTVDPALPRRPAARLALAALAGLAAWTALSRDWSPLPADAARDAERVLLYAVALAAAAGAWRERAAARALEPAFAAGTLVVIGYALAGRLAPGIVEQRASGSSGGRLEQPLTYWNATGALAAIGLVLCVRLAGDATRPVALRAAGAAGAVPLGLGVYLSFSRGALAALAAGLVVLVVLARDRAQVRAAAIGVVAAAVACAAAAASPAVRALEGGAREREGAIVLLVLLAIMAAAALAAAAAARRPAAPLALPRRAVPVGLAVAAALVVVPVAVGGTEPAPQSDRTFGATNVRFGNLGSNRYEYWDVALDTAGDHLLKGAGSSAFAAAWLRDRSIDESVHEAHSLELETLAELGLVGLALLALLFAGVAACAGAVHARDPVLAAGPVAALVVWLAHASIDWDWEMPAVTLIAVVLAGALLGRADSQEAA